MDRLAASLLLVGCGPALREPEPRPPEECDPESAQWDLSATGSDLEAHDGRLVMVAAVEPTPSTNAIADADAVEFRAALLTGWVEGGTFKLSCPGALSTNFYYPSTVVVIDADDSGDCSAGDLTTLGQYYGWDDHTVIVVTPDALAPVTETTATFFPICDYFE